MRPPLRLGLELPPVSVSRTSDADSAAQASAALWGVQELAVRADSLGFATLWVAEPPRTDLAADEVYAESCTMAASLAPIVGLAHLGVVMGDGDARHPSIAARDVTSLDHVTGGRAALMLRYPGHSLEAARICRGLFTRDETTVTGGTYQTSRAVNRPAPVQAGGPPLVARVEGPDEVVAALVAQVDAVCVTGGPDELQAIGEALQVAAGAAGPVSDAASVTAGFTGRPALLWLGCPTDADGLGRLRAAGVDGLICRFPASDGLPSASMVEELAALVGGWGHP